MAKKNKEKPRDSRNNSVEVEFRPDAYICSECQNKGVYWFVENFQIKASFCGCAKMREIHKLIESSGLARVVKEKRFDNFEVKTAKQADLLRQAQAYVKDVLNGLTRWLFVCGQSGSGKTHSCTAVAGELLNNQIPVYYMLWREKADMLNRFSKSSEESENQDRLFEIIKNVQVLYIDDFLKTDKGENGRLETPSKWDLNLAFKIINAREVANKATIISTEWLLDELYQIEESIAGRIFHNANKKAIIMPRGIENNYRMQV